MTRLILMRHGNTFEEGQTPIQVGARTDLPLTAFGKEQAQRMAKYLQAKGLVPQSVFAGALKRQTESAEIIAKEFGLQFQHAPPLTEIDYGLWEGLTSNEIVQRWPREYDEWSKKAIWQNEIFRGSFEEIWHQIEQWFQTLRNSSEIVLGVTSHGLLRFFRNEKVKTGHFCELNLQSHRVEICSWNLNPEIY